MKAILKDTVIAESDDVIFLEGNAYFPRDAVESRYLQRSRLVTPCFWKGLARYDHVVAGNIVARNAAWHYPHPPPWARKIKDRVAFWGDIRLEP